MVELQDGVFFFLNLSTPILIEKYFYKEAVASRSLAQRCGMLTLHS